MGHDHQQSSSSGAVIAIVVAVPLVAIIGIVAVAGAWLLVRTSSVQSQAVTSEQLTVELHGAETETRRAVAHVRIKDGMVQIQQSSDAATPETRLNFAVTLDREGNASVDGEEIDLDELRAQLAKLKDETSNAFSVQINADPECPVKLLIPVLDVCEEVGDIDFSIASSSSSDSTSDEDDTPSLTRKQSGFPLFLR